MRDQTVSGGAFCPLRLSVGIPFLTQLIDKPPLWSKPLTRALATTYPDDSLVLKIRSVGTTLNLQLANRCGVSNGSVFLFRPCLPS